MDQRQPTGRGRPRSDASRQAILDAAFELVRDVGYRATTVDAIAARAGTGKQTIYRWWSGKPAVVLEAVRTDASRQVRSPNTGSLAGDLRAFLRDTFAAGRRPGATTALRALMAEAQLDPDFAAAFRTDFLQHRRAALGEVLRRHPDQLRTSERLAMDTVFGVLWYRILAVPGPLGPALADQLVRLLVTGAE